MINRWTIGTFLICALFYQQLAPYLALAISLVVLCYGFTYMFKSE